MPTGVYVRRPETIARVKASNIKRYADPALHERISESIRRSWQDPEIREKRIKGRIGQPHPTFHPPKTLAWRQAQSRSVTGAKNHQWRGGITSPYGQGWDKISKAVLAEANYICQRCKKAPAIHVHHKLPVRFFSSATDAHSHNNLIALCRRCHPKEETRLRKALPLLDLLQNQKS